MPSFIVHHAFALKAAHAAPPAVSRLCAAFPVSYIWGSQGPDPFFFSPWARIGSSLHHDGTTAAVFQSLADAVNSSPAALAYLFGFCTHYALDCTTHPYIEDETRLIMERRNLSSTAAHKLCETDLDAALLRARGYTSPSAVPAYRLLNTTAPEWREAARLLAVAGGVTPDKAQVSMRSMRRIYKLLHSSRTIRTVLPLAESALGQRQIISSMLRADALLPEDAPNRAHRIWRGWDGAPHAEDFRTLTERQALPFALSLQRAACAAARKGIPFPAGLFPLNYSGQRVND